MAMIGLPLQSQAATNLTYGAWIPYWKKTEGVKEVRANLNVLKEISPFSYTVNKNGELIDTMRISEEPWKGLLKDARAKNVKILPSVLWTDSESIDKILGNQVSRTNHINDIVGEVLGRKFDGIDIDYENKLASTSPNFSVFIRDLSVMLHSSGSTLSCTVEARTPPESRFLNQPAVLEYANDYKELNKYCDQVRLMAYNQGTVDIKLNMARRLGGLYYPVADSAWVGKVIELAIRDISPQKLSLGVATFGYEMEVIDKNKYFDYKRLRSLTYKELEQMSRDTGLNPWRNNAGELALAYRRTDGQIRYATFSDAEAIAGKIRLAKMYGLRGVTVFKIDGESKDLWKILAI